MPVLQLLREIRSYAGDRETVGLSDEVIETFAARDPVLVEAIRAAHRRHLALRPEWGEVFANEERAACQSLQSDLVNFYADDTVNPYISLAARGPWLVTAHGAVVHDSGGYGMLGSGHAPESVLAAMSEPWVMANVMTPSVSHKRLTRRLRAELGQTRGACPFERFIFMNSGSESVTVAMRIADVLALRETGPGGTRPDAPVKYISLRGAFHGRTDRPAQISDSTLPKYRAHLHSFQGRDNLLLARPNDIDSLRAAFEQADEEGALVAAMFFEPVMGEGNPGACITRAFYDEARRLCTGHGTLLVADSIQAGLRGTGYLSIVDYPGFQDAEPPDMETYSKALNAGQYPMSVLAMTGRAADLYIRGVYGNTMTANPRALEVACAVLDGVTPALRANIVAQGEAFKRRLEGLAREFEGLITQVQGTGLLLSCEIDPDRASVVGADGIENWCRRNGLGIIHGGRNAIRFTPHFGLTEPELDLMFDLLRDAFRRIVDAEVRVEVGPQSGATPPV